MKIQQKLRLGLGFLFALILLLAAVSIYYVNSLSEASRSILTANYNSLEYAQGMQRALGLGDSERLDAGAFRHYLDLQKKNITEIGERELTDDLEREFHRILLDTLHLASQSTVRRDLDLVTTLNMQALERKSRIAGTTSTVAWQLIVGTASLCIILALVMLVNLPRTIAKPIQELLNGIQQISAKNYSSRLHMDRKDEFRDLADSFNLLAVQLGEYYSTSISRIMVEKKRVEALVNNMHDPVIILDSARTIMFVNDIACKILALRRDQLLGHSAVELALGNDLMRSLIHDGEAPTTEKSASHESMKIFSDNKESYYEKERHEITSVDSEGQVQNLGNVIVLRNVTSFKEYDFAKSSFIATVSHELKTPISSIKLSLQLLEKAETGSINEEQHQLIKSMAEDCTRLLKISSELLSLSQAETGNIKLNIQAVDAATVVNYAVAATKTLADQRHIVVHTKLSNSLPLVQADAEKVTWVLVNFLTNAVRYSPEHSEITVRVEPSQHAAHSIEFSVTDQGKGIEERYRSKIFDRYFQVPGSSKSGSGLGLAISREFIEALNGSIGVETEVGFGSRFWFCLDAAS